MELRQLRYFIMVAERGSISAASQTLHVAQSAVSRQIQKLEEEIGGPLFDRSVTGAVVNEAGQRLLERARFILSEVESASKDISNLSQDIRGTVRLSAPSSIGQLLYVPIINSFSRKYPRVQLQLSETKTEEVLERLAAGALDLGIVTEPSDHPYLAFSHLFTEPTVLCCRPDDKISRKKKLTTLAVKDLPLVISAGLRRIFSERFGTLTPAIQLDSIDAAIRLTLAGNHYAILPKSAIAVHPLAGRLGVIPVEGFEIDRSIAWARGRPGSLSSHALQTTIIEQVAYARAKGII